ncbi:MAG: protein-L-isoaspartate O-methyltransferase [Hyphomicrobiales bacterium]|nr:protein-L-isoaspartate O-methyltransferase [Hyphomicrobiales bacterium]
MMDGPFSDEEQDAPLASGARTLQFLLALRAQGVSDLPVLRAMERISREPFAPARYGDLSRTDISIPLPCGQMMTPPTVVASFLVSLGVEPGHRVLEIGTGSGYVSALLSVMGAKVVSIERFQSLALATHERLSVLRIGNVDLQHGDGLNATRLLGRFDRVLLNGVVDVVPEHLLQRLTPTGRLVGALKVEGLSRKIVIDRVGDNAVDHSLGGPVRLTALSAGVAETL